MHLLRQISFSLRLTRSHGIARRYFITNGFDGALTMLGLTTGFYAAGGVAPSVAVTACLGTAIALAVSGVSSAYISETAERKKELLELEHAMLAELEETAHGDAARIVPIMIAMVNGIAPFSIALGIMLPLWLAQHGVGLPFGPFETSIFTAFLIIFGLGVYLGRISGTFWLWAAVRTVLIALVVVSLIMALELNGV